MRKRRTGSRFRVAALLMAIGLVAAACSSSSETTTTAGSASTETTTTGANPIGGDQVVYYLAPTLFDEFQTVSAEAMQTFADERGIKLIILDPNNDVQAQINQMETAIQQDPAAIILSAVDAATMLPSIEAAKEAGIPVLAYDRLIVDAELDFSGMVGTVKMGELAAQETVDFLTEKNGSATGLVVEVLGDLADAWTVTIGEGSDSVLSGFPDIDHQVFDSPGWSQTRPAEVLDDLLTAGEEVDVLLLHADFRAPAIYPVLEKHGKAPGDIAIISVEGGPSGMDGIREGWINVAIGVPLSQQVESVWLALDAILAGSPLQPGQIEIGEFTADLIDEPWGLTGVLPGLRIDISNADDPTYWGNAG